MNRTAKPKITYVTAGAAGMFCGRCMHDNTLAQALTAQGCPTVLVPTYTPIRTDEREVTIDQVFFGGINVFLQQKIPLLRFVPSFVDRFLDNPKLIRRVTSKAIETDAKMLGRLTVSMLKGKAGNQRKEVKRLVNWLRDDMAPDVLVLSNMLIAGFIAELKKQMPVPVIVTLQGDDIFLNSLEDPHRGQCIELINKLDKFVDGYLVHSNYYANEMSELCGLNRDKMYVTPLGIDTGDFVGLLRDRQSAEQVNIGYLARLTTDKGLHNLVDAFILLKQQPETQHVKLKVAGWLGKDHESFANQQFAKLDAAGLQNEYEHLGTLDRAQKLKMLMELDILSVPTDYREPKGLSILEALAAGIPVVQPAHGVFPEMMDDLAGGLLFEPGNAADLSQKLTQLVQQPQLRSSLGQAGRENVLMRRNGQTMAEDTIAVINQILLESC